MCEGKHRQPILKIGVFIASNKECDKVWMFYVFFFIYISPLQSKKNFEKCCAFGFGSMPSLSLFYVIIEFLVKLVVSSSRVKPIHECK